MRSPVIPNLLRAGDEQIGAYPIQVWLSGQDLHLRLKNMRLVLAYATTAPQIF